MSAILGGVASLFRAKRLTSRPHTASGAPLGKQIQKSPLSTFFGGSSMWGTGADDASTIPSLFTQISGFASENFGQTGYTAHQSLVLLIQLLQDGRRPDIVVFYDGGNEVTNKCRAELTPWSHEREGRVASALKAYRKRENPYDLFYLVMPLKAFAEKLVATPVVRRLDVKSKFNCHTDPAKAQKIADNLIEDWAVAKKLVEAYNGKFFGMLQPVSFFSNTNDRVVSNAYKEQFEAVYPLVKQKMASMGDLYDLTDALDRNEYIYTDFAHLAPNGNKYIAEEMAKIITNSAPQQAAVKATR